MEAGELTEFFGGEGGLGGPASGDDVDLGGGAGCDVVGKGDKSDKCN